MKKNIIYYFGRLLSKIEEPIIGKFVRKFGHVCENRIVFKNRMMQDFSDNARALFEYLIENEYNQKYEIIWAVSDKKRLKKYQYKNVKFVTAENKFGWNSCRSYYYSNTAKYFFYTNNTANLNRYHCEGQITVNLWHGCGYKGATRVNKDIPRCSTMEFFDFALVPGDIFIKTKSEYWDCDKEKILPMGYPRYDWLLDKKNNKAEILCKLFGWKDDTTKAIIWMPTFRKSSLIGYAENNIEFPFDLPAIRSLEDLKEIDRMCKKKNILLIIKKHPLQVGWAEEKGFDNIRYITDDLLNRKEIQLYKLVGTMDALISDYSSIAVDYLLLDRPLGFVLADMEQYREARGFVFENILKYMPGEKIYDFYGLKEFIDHVAENTDFYKQERQMLLPVMHNQTENYCKRITNFFRL